MWKCQYTPHSTWPLWWLGYSALEHWTRPVWTPVSLLWGLPGGQLRPLPSHQYQPHILPHPPPSPLFSRWHTPCPPPMCPWIHVFCIQKKLEWRCQTDCQLINLFRHWDFERTIWAEKSFSLAFHRIAVTWLSVLRVFYYNHYRCCRKKGWPMPPPLQQSNKIHCVTSTQCKPDADTAKASLVATDQQKNSTAMRKKLYKTPTGGKHCVAWSSWCHPLRFRISRHLDQMYQMLPFRLSYLLIKTSLKLFSKCICHRQCICICVCLFVGHVMSRHHPN